MPGSTRQSYSTQASAGITLRLRDAPAIVGTSVEPAMAGSRCQSCSCWARPCSRRSASGASPGASTSSSASSSGEERQHGRVRADPLEHRRELEQSVVPECRHRGVPGDAARGHAHGHRHLLADDERVDGAPVGQHVPVVGFRERVVAAQVGPLAHQPVHAHLVDAVFLVGLGDQQDVAVRHPPAAGEHGERDGAGRRLALHVERSAPPQVAVAHLSAERRAAPVGRIGIDDVRVADDRERRARPAAAYPGDQVGACRIPRDPLGFHAVAREVGLEHLDAERLVARRVRRVDPDQVASERDHLVEQVVAERLGELVMHPSKATAALAPGRHPSGCRPGPRNGPSAASDRAGGQRAHVLGREAVARDTPVAALDLLDHAPGDLAHVLALDRDHRVGETLDDLAASGRC